MKTTFKQFLQEAEMPKAESIESLFRSISSGRFNEDGSQLEVDNNFSCHGCGLTTLVGGPKRINGDFSCSGNKLTSLKGAPIFVGGFFWGTKNNLTSLEGAPAEVGGDFCCNGNQLISLDGGLTTVGGNFSVDSNNLQSLKDIHIHIRSINGKASFILNPIKSHVLGLLKIKKLQKVALNNKEVEKIINKYLPEGDIFACQQELIDNGYEAYAQL